jgi:hypothetical protein
MIDVISTKSAKKRARVSESDKNKPKKKHKALEEDSLPYIPWIWI